MVIISANSVRKTTLQTPWGLEEAIHYLGWTFLPTNAYTERREAMAACRRDLDAGIFSIVVEEKDIVRVWCTLPEQMLQSAA